MTIWQADFYRRPLRSETGEPLWELLVCDRTFQFTFGETCPQSAATAGWVAQQIQVAMERAGDKPAQIEVFRPQSLALLETACKDLEIKVIATRNPATLKQWLRQRAAWYPTLPNATGEPYNPLALDRPPPVPLAETLMGDQWRFAAIQAGDFEQTFPYQPIPITALPPERMPLQLGLPSTTPIPGIVIDAGRRAMPLAQWLQQANPAWLSYQPGQPDGAILDAGLVDRWVLVTFEDPEVAAAGRTFEQRKQASQGLHFILVRPDDSGMTQTGLWLLQQPILSP
ncbi:Tab2/Atab2 family RNA-binding protein [Pseudanabaena sp. FACHB-2040]|uniref:Tab2/Atab2 family RNA-binding protein n=1 Tax=Pseudanabaena sp. FACHB-2040 TaxID=2692859 RepID=UPI00168655E8|nr:Tab2/Atab2 family RNA-binding protein [Pseudanabaena sp. FACHB-2040]MBD2259507.1 Tab2/Atab2 family RNA-binding protein [Pseudanabaena sp. FACHB-2040]